VADRFSSVSAAAQPERGIALGERPPELVGTGPWLNSPPLTLEGQRGKVVLVDFWTHACVNCVRTLPHLTRWHRQYAAQGLVIIGVHTPEFSFERETANVQKAVDRHGIGYPVALDNRYATWSAFQNQYWPAVYLIGRDGRLVFKHVGDGEQDRVEKAIQQALAQPLP